MSRNGRAARTGGILIALGTLLVCATLGDFTKSLIGLGMIFIGLLLSYPYLIQKEEKHARRATETKAG